MMTLPVYFDIVRKEDDSIRKELVVRDLLANYEVGDVLSFDTLQVYLLEYTDMTEYTETKLTCDQYQVNIEDVVGLNHLFDGDGSYTFQQTGTYVLSVRYGDLLSSGYGLSVNSSVTTVVAIVVTSVVLLFIAVVVYNVRRYRSGKGFLAKREQRRKEIVENYKKELELQKKKEESEEMDDHKE